MFYAYFESMNGFFFRMEGMKADEYMFTGSPVHATGYKTGNELVAQMARLGLPKDGYIIVRMEFV